MSSATSSLSIVALKTKIEKKTAEIFVLFLKCVVKTDFGQILDFKIKFIFLGFKFCFNSSKRKEKEKVSNEQEKRSKESRWFISFCFIFIVMFLKST